jgi:hypothetical protein
MAMRARLLWLVPLCLTSTDALAWGLYTHLYYAQVLLWAVPLADRRFRLAAARFPGLVMAGACLPDLSLVTPGRAGAGLRSTHRWPNVARLLRMATDDVSRALALGYFSHLLSDVIAHNHFVPAHESVWFDAPVVTHALCEWAMDRYVAPQLFATPAQVLRRDEQLVTEFVVRSFVCERGYARRAVLRLARADRWLRCSRIPGAVHVVAQLGDRYLRRRFKHYLNETAGRLEQLNRLLEGELPQWEAELCAKEARAALGEYSLQEIRARLPLPADLFVKEPAPLARAVAR